jgi:hypothetical protein
MTQWRIANEIAAFAIVPPWSRRMEMASGQAARRSLLCGSRHVGRAAA